MLCIALTQTPTRPRETYHPIVSNQGVHILTVYHPLYYYPPNGYTDTFNKIVKLHGDEESAIVGWHQSMWCGTYMGITE